MLLCTDLTCIECASVFTHMCVVYSVSVDFLTVVCFLVSLVGCKSGGLHSWLLSHAALWHLTFMPMSLWTCVWWLLCCVLMVCSLLGVHCSAYCVTCELLDNPPDVPLSHVVLSCVQWSPDLCGQNNVFLFFCWELTCWNLLHVKYWNFYWFIPTKSFERRGWKWKNIYSSLILI